MSTLVRKRPAEYVRRSSAIFPIERKRPAEYASFASAPYAFARASEMSAVTSEFSRSSEPEIP